VAGMDCRRCAGGAIPAAHRPANLVVGQGRADQKMPLLPVGARAGVAHDSFGSHPDEPFKRVVVAGLQGKARPTLRHDRVRDIGPKDDVTRAIDRFDSA
jgi:hypothetical protein